MSLPSKRFTCKLTVVWCFFAFRMSQRIVPYNFGSQNVGSGNAWSTNGGLPRRFASTGLKSGALDPSGGVIVHAPVASSTLQNFA